MDGERRFVVSLTQSEALVLYRYLSGLEDAGKLDPGSPTFGWAVHWALDAVYQSLEDQLAPLWQQDSDVPLDGALPRSSAS